VPKGGPRAHDLVLVGTTKPYSGTEPDIVMESISLILSHRMSAIGILQQSSNRKARFVPSTRSVAPVLCNFEKL
jgi:hypothetical protein